MSQPNSLRASPNNSANPEDSAERARPTNTCPPLENTRNSLEAWPNSDNRLTTPSRVPLKPRGSVDPLGSRASATSSNGNLFMTEFDLQNTPTTSPSRRKIAGQETT